MMFSSFRTVAAFTALCSVAFASEVQIAEVQQSIAKGQVTLDNHVSEKVPGENPFSYCAPTQDNILQIERLDLSPNPPHIGSSFNYAIAASLSKPVEQGTRLQLTIKYGLIKLYDQEIDLCDQLVHVHAKCPISAGRLDMSDTYKIPSAVPDGTYTVVAKAITPDDKLITCASGTVRLESK